MTSVRLCVLIAVAMASSSRSWICHLGTHVSPLGATRTENEDDLSLAQLSDDFVNVLNTAHPTLPNEIILVGHSMGGAVVVDVGSRGLIKNVIGVIVLDIVEGRHHVCHSSESP